MTLTTLHESQLWHGCMAVLFKSASICPITLPIKQTSTTPTADFQSVLGDYHSISVAPIIAVGYKCTPCIMTWTMH